MGHVHRRYRRTTLGIALLAIVTLGLTGPAFAEGGFSSYVHWTKGDKSRTWHDRNTDGASTRVALRHCEHIYSGSTAPIRLRRQKAGPDETVGTREILCEDSRSWHERSWGDLRSGDYHFDYQGDGILHAGSEGADGVRVRY